MRDAEGRSIVWFNAWRACREAGARRAAEMRIGFGRAVSRILSAPCGGENHLSRQPIPGTRLAFAKRGAGRSGVPYLALHPMGFSVPRRLRFARCALTAPFHPCRAIARESEGGRFVFCGTVRRKVSRPSARVYPDRTGPVTRHRALWCSDFPLPARAGSDSPPFQNQS